MVDNNQIQLFNFKGNEVRTLVIDNKPYFVGKDIAEILGYKNGSRDINRHVDEEDRMTVKLPQYQNGTLVSKTIIINESGMYSLVLGSKLPQAKEFKRWVTSEVLPTIRKHGMYATGEMLEKMISSPDFAIKTFQALKAEKQRSLQLANQVKQLQPKADYFDDVLADDELLTVTQIAQDYGMTAYQLNLLLFNLGVQYRINHTWALYKEYQGKGYVKSYTGHNEDGEKYYTFTKWTQKGRNFLHDLLKDHNYIPLKEMY